MADKKQIIHFVIDQLKYRQNNLSDEIVNRLNDLDALITGTSFRERFNRFVLLTASDEAHNFVGGELIENPIPSERVQDLVDEAVTQPEIITENLELFVHSEGPRLFEFGYKLAQSTEYALFDKIISVQESFLPEPYTQFIGGYLSGIKGKDREKWESLMLSLLSSDSLRSIGVDLAFRTGVTEAIVRELLSLYREERIESKAFSHIGIHVDDYQLSEKLVQEILVALIDQLDERALSILIELADYFYCKKNQLIEMPEDLIYTIITMDKITQNQETMIGYHWRNVVKTFRKQFPYRDLEIFEFLIVRLKSFLRAIDYGCRVVDEIAGDYPIEAWNIVGRLLDNENKKSWHISMWLQDEMNFGEDSNPGPIRLFEPELIMNWIAEEKNKRVYLMTGCLPKTFNLENGGKLTQMFVEEYGDDKDTAENLIDHFYCCGWNGPESVFRSQQRDMARSWLTEINSPKIRNWLLLYIDRLCAIIEKNQISEERGY